MWYRLLSLFSFCILVIKFPILILISKEPEQLNPYFIVTSFSIATNFVCSDIMSFAAFGRKVSGSDVVVFCTIFFATSILMFINYADLFLLFIIFNISIFFSSLVNARLRQIDITFLIYFELILSVCQITAVPAISNYFDVNLGLLLIVVTACFSFLTATIYVYKHGFVINEVFDLQNKAISSRTMYLNMLITQSERVIIAKYMPNVLIFINIVSVLLTGLKRMIFDDNKFHSDIIVKNGDVNGIIRGYSILFLTLNLSVFFLLSALLQFALKTSLGNKIEPVIEHVALFKTILFIYIGISPVSTLVVHYFRNVGSTILALILYFLPSLAGMTFLYFVFKASPFFLGILLFVSCLHFVMYFFFNVNSYFKLDLKTSCLVLLNLVVGIAITILTIAEL